MAEQANTPRQASCRVVVHQLQGLKLVAGIVLKTTRAYKRPGQPQGKTQTDIQNETEFRQEYMSAFETGGTIPSDPALGQVLLACGFDTTKPGAAAFERLLRFVRDNEDDLAKLEGEIPD